jgi:hypothetical protein
MADELKILEEGLNFENDSLVSKLFFFIESCCAIIGTYFLILVPCCKLIYFLCNGMYEHPEFQAIVLHVGCFVIATVSIVVEIKQNN